MPDPVAKAINCMLDHIHVMDHEMQVMYKTIEKMGGETKGLEIEELEDCEIIPAVIEERDNKS